MGQTLAEAVLAVAVVYLGAGLLFAAAFHARGMRRVDAAADRSTWGFRVLVTPGIVALWPVLARAWRRAAARTEVGP